MPVTHSKRSHIQLARNVTQVELCRSHAEELMLKDPRLLPDFPRPRVSLSRQDTDHGQHADRLVRLEHRHDLTSTAPFDGP